MQGTIQAAVRLASPQVSEAAEVGETLHRDIIVLCIQMMEDSGEFNYCIEHEYGKSALWPIGKNDQYFFHSILSVALVAFYVCKSIL
jgi:hypothetical protein